MATLALASFDHQPNAEWSEFGFWFAQFVDVTRPVQFVSFRLFRAVLFACLHSYGKTSACCTAAVLRRSKVHPPLFPQIWAVAFGVEWQKVISVLVNGFQKLKVKPNRPFFFKRDGMEFAGLSSSVAVSGAWRGRAGIRNEAGLHSLLLVLGPRRWVQLRSAISLRRRSAIHYPLEIRANVFVLYPSSHTTRFYTTWTGSGAIVTAVKKLSFWWSFLSTVL